MEKIAPVSNRLSYDDQSREGSEDHGLFFKLHGQPSKPIPWQPGSTVRISRQVMEILGKSKKPKRSWLAYRTGKIISRFGDGRGRASLVDLAEVMRDLTGGHGQRKLTASRYVMRDTSRKLLAEDPEETFYRIVGEGASREVVSHGDASILKKHFVELDEVDHFPIKAEDLRTIETFRRACFIGALRVWSFESITGAARRFGISRRTGFSYVKGLDRENVFRQVPLTGVFKSKDDAWTSLRLLKLERSKYRPFENKAVEIAIEGGSILQPDHFKNGRMVYKPQFVEAVEDRKLIITASGSRSRILFERTATGYAINQTRNIFENDPHLTLAVKAEVSLHFTVEGGEVKGFVEYTGSPADLVGVWCIGEVIGSRFPWPKGYKRFQARVKAEEGRDRRRSRWIAPNIRT